MYTNPREHIGWTFCVVGLADRLLFFAHEYVVYALVTDPGRMPGCVADMAEPTLNIMVVTLFLIPGLVWRRLIETKKTFDQ